MTIDTAMERVEELAASAGPANKAALELVMNVVKVTTAYRIAERNDAPYLDDLRDMLDRSLDLG